MDRGQCGLHPPRAGFWGRASHVGRTLRVVRPARMRSFLLLLLFSAPGAALAQPVTLRPDPALAAYLTQVSPDTLEATVRRLASFGTRHTFSDQTSETRGIGAAGRWIERQMRRYAALPGARLDVSLERFTQPPTPRTPRPVMLTNVLARLPGTDPADTRIFLVSGHYDSRASGGLDADADAPGANDDASGTAAVMEMARVLAAARFPATLIFAAFSGEEQGLLGARHLAAVADSAGWNLAGMITLDIVGNTTGGAGIKDNRTIRVFSEGTPQLESEAARNTRYAIGGENDSQARQLARYLEEVGERYEPQADVKLIYRRDRFLRGGDHTAFSERGFAAVRMTEPNEDFSRQHQNVRTENGRPYGDLPENVDYDYVARVTRVNMAGLMNLASAPPPPQNVGIVNSELGYDTTLRWAAPESAGRVAGYYVLIRETTASRWEQKLIVGNVTEVTLPNISKDNYFFAVQSVDAEGHESEIIWPRPVR
jgi:hypothetical protein